MCVCVLRLRVPGLRTMRMKEMEKDCSRVRKRNVSRSPPPHSFLFGVGGSAHVHYFGPRAGGARVAALWGVWWAEWNCGCGVRLGVAVEGET
eukprot:scaffold26062_cov31-Tisochrysis_lutea.AAC.1